VQLFKYYIWLIFLFFGHLTTAQNIWPGDVNNNGIVNKVDLLYIGYAFGTTGIARLEPSDTWGAKEAPELWTDNFPNGTNYAFADCNGDGIVDRLDADIVINNLNLQHDDVVFVPDEVPMGVSGIDPACRFVNTPSAAPVDQRFSFDIALGSDELPIDSLSGFAFFLNIEPDIIGKNALDFAELNLSSDTWIDGEEASSILEVQEDLDAVKLKAAYTKTDQISLSGGGSVATVSFIVESNVIDLLIFEADTITFTIDSMIVLDNNLEPIPIVPDTLKLAIDRELILNTEALLQLPTVAIFPNPNNGLLILESSEPILGRITLFDAYGGLVYDQILTKQNLQVVEIQDIPNGMYFAKIETTYGIQTKKVFKYSN